MECDYTFLDQLSYEYCLPKGFTSAADFFEYLRGKVNTDSQFGSTRQADPFHNGFGGKSKFDREAALSLSQYFGGDERCLIFELPRHHGCLRWTHNRINASMMFGHGGQPDESVWKHIITDYRVLFNPSSHASESLAMQEAFQLPHQYPRPCLKNKPPMQVCKMRSRDSKQS